MAARGRSTPCRGRRHRSSTPLAPWWRTRVRSMSASRPGAASLEALRGQVAALASAAAVLDASATARAKAAREALDGTPVESARRRSRWPGSRPAGTLRKRRQQLSTDLDAARSEAGQAGTEHSLAEERTRTSKAALDAAVAARDAAMAAFPGGLAAALATARASLATARYGGEADSRRSRGGRTAPLPRKRRGSLRPSGTLERRTRLRARRVDAAQQALTRQSREHASQVGRLEELRRQRDAQDLAGAEDRLREASERRAAVPVPERIVAEADVADGSGGGDEGESRPRAGRA